MLISDYRNSCAALRIYSSLLIPHVLMYLPKSVLCVVIFWYKISCANKVSSFIYIYFLFLVSG